MSVNIGNVDRYARLIVGIALVLWALGFIPNVEPSAWGWIGLVPLMTALFGYCPAYGLFGFDTCRRA